MPPEGSFKDVLVAPKSNISGVFIFDIAISYVNVTVPVPVPEITVIFSSPSVKGELAFSPAETVHVNILGYLNIITPDPPAPDVGLVSFP